jgi:hypothetical protein
MKKRLGPFVFVLLIGLATGVWCQEHYTEGPVWRVQLIRVKPGKLDAYLTSLRKSTKPLLDEEKKQGAIMDYKVFLKETKSNPEDWDIAVALQFKNHAALDGLTAKGEELRDKILAEAGAAGGHRQAQRNPRDNQFGSDAGSLVEIEKFSGCRCQVSGRLFGPDAGDSLCEKISFRRYVHCTSSSESICDPLEEAALEADFAQDRPGPLHSLVGLCSVHVAHDEAAAREVWSGHDAHADSGGVSGSAV